MSNDATFREDDIRGLLDREAIRSLPIEYCHYIWAQQSELCVALFTTDGRFEGPDPENLDRYNVVQGHDELRTLYESVPKQIPLPFIHNHHVILTAKDEAIGFVYAELRYGSLNYRTTHFGVYEDVYVKTEGRWKFKKRRLTITPIPS